jgi:uncharacterized surface protein with fasciclin (FAS1) repeats
MNMLFSIIVLSALLITIPLAAAPVQAKSGSNIVQTALAVNSQTGEFSTLIAAVVAADLATELSGNRPYTVFAPTDAAFAALGLNPVTITAIPKDTLRNILLYHVTNGVRQSQSVVGTKSIRMANGQEALASGATIDGAAIVSTNIRTSNGVIHVIDGVMLP